MPEHAQARALYDHPFFGRWPAITENHYGTGTLLYEGTYLSDTLQTKVLAKVLREVGIAGPDQQLPAAIHVRHGVNRLGKRVHYYFNYSSEQKSFAYSYGSGKDLLTGTSTAHGQPVTLRSWDVAIMEEE
jgi:beta-galactosidase